MNSPALFASAALLLAAFGAQAAPKATRATPPRPDTIALARERVKDALKDPESARFKGEFVGKDGAVCGLVNARNSYGGYGGFERYIVTAERVQLDGDEQWKVDSRWEDVCADFEPRA
jgi:hypothetical protein